MATLKVMALAASIGFLLTAEAQGQQCLQRGDESAGERLRRQAAVDFVVEVNAAQTRQQRETGRYASLAEIRQSTNAPLGFVPRLVVDQFGYMVKVIDMFDPCGFALFSDERGVVFEAQPTTLRKSPRPELPSEVPRGQDERARSTAEEAPAFTPTFSACRRFASRVYLSRTRADMRLFVWHLRAMASEGIER